MSAPDNSDGSAPSSSVRREPISPQTADHPQRKLLEEQVVDFSKIARACRRGLADWSRPKFWKVMMGFYPVNQDRWAAIEAHSEKDYNNILTGSCELDERGDPIMNNSVGASIDADIPRTMPTLNFFLQSESHCCSSTSRRQADSFSETQRCLRRIICTLATVNKGFGYVQGMTQLVGQLLIAFSEGRKENVTRNVEADVFFCFQTLLAYLGDDFCRTLDDNKDSGVISTVRHFDNVLQFLDMELYDHLQMLDIQSEHFALRWLMLLFTQEFNIADSLRVWDFLFSFGDQIRNSAMYVAAAMCFHIRDTLLSKDCLSDAMPLLLDYPPGDTDAFLKLAMRWTVMYDFSMITALKNATRDEIIALRKHHGLQPQDSISTKVQNLVLSLFR